VLTWKKRIAAAEVSRATFTELLDFDPQPRRGRLTADQRETVDFISASLLVVHSGLVIHRERELFDLDNPSLARLALTLYWRGLKADRDAAAVQVVKQAETQQSL